MDESNLPEEPFTISSDGENNLFLTFNRDIKDASLTICDIQGRLVVSKHIGRISGGTVIETVLQTVSSAYILKVADGNSIFTKPMVNTRY